MTKIQFADKSSWLRVAIIAAACASALGLGILFAMLHLQLRELVILILALVTFGLVVIPTERVLLLGFWLWIFSFGLGWRTIDVVGVLSIHPSEVLAWLLFGVLITRSVLQRQPLDWKIPIALPLLMILAGVGVVTALGNNISWDAALLESKVVFSLIPSFYIVKWLVHQQRDWEWAVTLTIPLGVYLALLGFMDLYLPGVSRAIGGVAETTSIERGTFHGFERALFLIFGAPLAAAVILPFLGFAVHAFMYRATGWLKWLLLAVVLFQVFGIVLSGYRLLYYATVIFFIIFAMLDRRGWIFVLGGLAVTPFLPGSLIERFLSLIDERYADSSQFNRIDRAAGAWELALRSPLWGNGWVSSGYVHSDLIQLAANIGFVAVALLLSWVGWLVFRLYQIYRRGSVASSYAAVLIPSLVAVVVTLAGEGLVAFIQLMIPIWFLFAMANRWIELDQVSKLPTILDQAPK